VANRYLSREMVGHTETFNQRSNLLLFSMNNRPLLKSELLQC